MMKTLLKSLLLIALFSFAYESRGQQTVHFDVDNTLGAPSGCDWEIKVYNNSNPGTALDSFIVTSGTRLTGSAGCKNWFSGGTIDFIVVNDGAGCFETFGSSGSFPYTAVNPCGGSTCSSLIDCSGGTPGPPVCTPSSTAYIILRIY